MRIGLVMVLVLFTSNASASQEWVQGAVVDFLRKDGALGGCMVKISATPSVVSCSSSGWVSLDCMGSFTSKSEGEAKFSLAQLASVTNRPLRILFDDSEQHNGYCTAPDIRYTP